VFIFFFNNGFFIAKCCIVRYTPYHNHYGHPWDILDCIRAVSEVITEFPRWEDNGSIQLCSESVLRCPQEAAAAMPLTRICNT
jgi:hypothetical protein